MLEAENAAGETDCLSFIPISQPLGCYSRQPTIRVFDAQEQQQVWLPKLPHRESCPWSAGTAGMGCLHHMAGRPCVRNRCPPGCRHEARAHLYKPERSCKHTKLLRHLHKAGYMAFWMLACGIGIDADACSPSETSDSHENGCRAQAGTSSI